MIRVATVVLVPLVVFSAGCRSMVLWLPERTKTIAADYPYLADKRVGIVVRADTETLCVYPQAQWDVADHVRVALEGNIPGISVVEPRKIVDLQRSDPGWESMDPALLGKRFGADRLLEIELTEYTTREPESPHLYRGHISAAIRVYNTEYPNSQPAYRTDVRTVYPPEGPGHWGTNDRAIRRATMEAFALDVAGKFYDRKVKVR